MLRLSTTQSYPGYFAPAVVRPNPVSFNRFGFSTQASDFEQADQSAQDEAIRKSQDALDLIKRSRRTTIEYFCDGKVPLDTDGTMKLPQIPPRGIVKRYSDEKSIDEDTLKDHLFNNVLQKFMEAVGKQDAEAIHQVAEKTFADKIVAEMPSLKGKSLRYKKAAGDVDLDSVYLLDKLFLKGVGSERAKNGTNFDYVVIQDLEVEGLKQYVHKYNLGFQRYYFLKAFDADILSKLNMEEQKKNQKEFYYRERLMRDAANK